MTILTFPDEHLRQVCEPVYEDVSDLARDLIELSYRHNGSGLAANQVGELKRLMVVTLNDQEYALANPEVVETSSDMLKDKEGCLSLPGITATVPRPRFAHIKGIDPFTHERQEVKAYGIHARVVMHEIDHLDARLFIDHLSRVKRMRLMREYHEGMLTNHNFRR